MWRCWVHAKSREIAGRREQRILVAVVAAQCGGWSAVIGTTRTCPTLTLYFGCTQNNGNKINSEKNTNLETCRHPQNGGVTKLIPITRGLSSYVFSRPRNRLSKLCVLVSHILNFESFGKLPLTSFLQRTCVKPFKFRKTMKQTNMFDKRSEHCSKVAAYGYLEKSTQSMCLPPQALWRTKSQNFLPY